MPCARPSYPICTSAMTEAAPGATAGPELRLHPWSFVFMLGGMARQVVAPLVALVFVGGKPSRGSLMAGLAVCVLTLWTLLKARAYRYQLEGQTLHIREGLLDRTQRHIPLVRIQAISQRRKLLHRLLGVTELRLESASGAKPEAVMRVLGMHAAARLEGLLRTQVAVAPTGEPTPAPPVAQTTRLLHQLPPAEILRLGLVSNRGMVLVGLVIATVSQHDVLRKEFARQMNQLSHWVQETVSAQVQASHLLQVQIAIALSVLVFMLLTRLLSVALAFFRYYGFRLEQQGSKLMAAHGLSTRVRAAARLQRLQRWQIDETWLHRRFGRCSLGVLVAGGNHRSGAQGLDPGLQLTELAPIGSWDQVQALLKTCLPTLDWTALAWQPLRGAWAGRLWRQGRWLVPTMLLLLVAPALDTYDLSPAWTWAIAAGVMAAWLTYTHLWIRFAAYARAGDLLLYRSGVLHRCWVVVDSTRLHTIRLDSSPLDRSLGVVHFRANAQGGAKRYRTLDIPYMPRVAAEALRKAIWPKIADPTQN